MKKWYTFTAIFFSSYLAFLVATIPLALVINNIALPKGVNISSVSGTVWQGKIAHLSINGNHIQKINTDLSFWSLFLLSPEVDVTFGDAMQTGPEGKFTLAISSSELKLDDVVLFISANRIASQLPLPIPATAQGSFELTLSELILNTEKLTCDLAQGEMTWVRAGVVALEKNIKLGTLNAGITCEEGDFLAKIAPKNNLGLSFDARLALATQKVSGKGYLLPGNKFPAELRSALSFLGRPDDKGRYVLKI